MEARPVATQRDIGAELIQFAIDRHLGGVLALVRDQLVARRARLHGLPSCADPLQRDELSARVFFKRLEHRLEHRHARAGDGPVACHIQSHSLIDGSNSHQHVWHAN
jgi:hypothetical protein